MAATARQAAVIGGNRIPFARSNGPYFEASNQDMLTATLDGLAARFGLGGEKRRRGRRRRRPQALARLQPDARVRAGQRVRQRDARVRHPAGVRHRTAGGAARREQDRARPDRRRRRRRRRHDERRADRGQRGPARGADGGQPHEEHGRPVKLLGRLRPGQIVPEIPRNAEPRTGMSMGEHAAVTAEQWEIGREEQDELAATSPPAHGRGVGRGLLRRPGHARSWASSATTTCAPTRPPRSWPS